MNIHSQRLLWMERLLVERFGHCWYLEEVSSCLILKLEGHAGAIEFDCLEAAFMKTGRPDGVGCEDWKIEHPWQSVLEEAGLPAPSSRALLRPLIEKHDNVSVCHYDILGLAFWAMNRLEEVNASKLDEHQRFSSCEAHASQFDYLDRPIVDEWLHILGQLILAQWPQIKLKNHQFKIFISHDVDRPSRYGFRSVSGLIRAVGSDVVRRKLWACGSSVSVCGGGLGCRGGQLAQPGPWMSRVIEPLSMATGKGWGGVPTPIVIQ